MVENPISSSNYQSLECINLNELNNCDNTLNNMNDSTSLSEVSLNIHSFFFVFSNEENNVEPNQTTTKKEPKRSGRKRHNQNLQKKRRKSHDKFAPDNVHRKVQVDYLKFLVNDINKIIKDIYIIKNCINEINDIDIILNKKYLDFFDVYYKNKENINLKEYGLNDLNISLINIKKYNDLIEEKKKNTENFTVYIQKIEECIKTHFRPKHNLFLVKTE